jgi:hypothetical protein
MKQVREETMGERFSFVKKGDHEEILMRFGCFTSFYTSVKVIAELGFCSRTFNPFQDIWDS